MNIILQNIKYFFTLDQFFTYLFAKKNYLNLEAK